MAYCVYCTLLTDFVRCCRLKQERFWDTDDKEKVTKANRPNKKSNNSLLFTGCCHTLIMDICNFGFNWTLHCSTRLQYRMLSHYYWPSKVFIIFCPFWCFCLFSFIFGFSLLDFYIIKSLMIFLNMQMHISVRFLYYHV